jgi:hypothetical protein
MNEDIVMSGFSTHPTFITAICHDSFHFLEAVLENDYAKGLAKRPADETPLIGRE